MKCPVLQFGSFCFETTYALMAIMPALVKKTKVPLTRKHQMCLCSIDLVRTAKLNCFEVKGSSPGSRVYVVTKAPSGGPVRENLIRELAKLRHEDEGTCEIDDNATISEGDDNGCYVSAWVWVPFDETPLDKEADEKDTSDKS